MRYSFNQFVFGIRKFLSLMDRENLKYDFIIANERGGLVGGVVLSHALEIPLKTIKMSERDDPDSRMPAELASAVAAANRVLLIEDIVDSGTTLKKIFNHIDRKKVDVYTFVGNSQVKHLYEFVDVEFDRKLNKQWVEFFWEKL